MYVLTCCMVFIAFANAQYVFAMSWSVFVYVTFREENIYSCREFESSSRKTPWMQHFTTNIRTVQQVAKARRTLAMLFLLSNMAKRDLRRWPFQRRRSFMEHTEKSNNMINSFGHEWSMLLLFVCGENARKLL